MDDDSMFRFWRALQFPLMHAIFTELTFIICARSESDASPQDLTSSSLKMVGDVNLFLKGEVHDPEFEVEAEIMIAGESHLALFAPPPRPPEPVFRISRLLSL